MRDDFTSKLQAGSAAFVAAISPPAPESVRSRGDKRRRRKAITSAVLALAICAGGSGIAFTSFDQPGGPAGPPGNPLAASSAQAGRPGIAAVTTNGALVVLDPLTGEATKLLVASGVAGGALAVSPDGSTVYFAVKLGCKDEIESVPVTGGRPAAITAGVLPAVSADGTKLAFAREPFSGGSSHLDFLPGCSQPTPASSEFTVVVRDLASGRETVYPVPPQDHYLQPVAISRISWGPGGQQLLVSAGPQQDNEGWDLAVMDLATARYYLPSVTSAGTSSVPVTAGADAARSYYREAVFLPDGQIFANVVCCSGVPVHEKSSLLDEIGSSGRLSRQVATGFTDRDHSSLNADPAGNWVLYLSGPDLFLSQGGNSPFKLTSGLIAAAWL